jgi:hypothetical protein
LHFLPPTLRRVARGPVKETINCREFEINERDRTDIKVSGTAGPEGPLDVSGTVRGQVVIAFSTSFRRHGGDGRESGCGGINGQGERS